MPLLRLMPIAREEGLVFNSKKYANKTNEIAFFGSVYEQEDLRPDSSKTEDTRKMHTPDDKDDLRRFIGLMNYLAAYIPHFANRAPLRQLHKTAVPFQGQDHQRTYEDFKGCIDSNHVCILQPTDGGNSRSGCLTERPGRLISSGQQTCGVRVKDTHTDTISLLEHRAGSKRDSSGTCLLS